jgi:1-deoxy-D-xylulose-5-phosphate reductoisomerase
MKSDIRHTLAIFGATGSIGRSTLEVVRQHSEAFSIRYLTANNNASLLIDLVREFRPAAVAVVDADACAQLRAAVGDLTTVLDGSEGLLEIAAREDYDTMVSSLVGFAGLLPTVAAIRAGKRIALANKETLVVAGEYILNLARQHDAPILPIDSEHSAILQCIVGEPEQSVSRIILTASGGPFRGWTAEALELVTPEQALKHPNWTMGAKITIDSATLMNKGLEVIEAHWLFGLAADAISVIVHPQSIIHSMVEFHDGSVKAQLGVPDMKLPIHYALTWPQRLAAQYTALDLAAIGSLTFEEADTDTFRCLRLAYDSLRAGGIAPAILNAANEVAVAAFLRNELPFTGIPEVIDHCLQGLPNHSASELDAIVNADVQAREFALRRIASPTEIYTVR